MSVTLPKEYRREGCDVGLPKWPQMVLWGTPIAPEAAMEIIRRTDSFFSGWGGGNDREWDDEAKRLMGRPVANYGDTNFDHHAYNLLDEEWNERWGCVRTECITNTWVSSAYIGGPGGWCHPDGTIHFNRNVGKWPDGDELFEEMVLLAKTFPFLDMTAVFMSGETCEDATEPLLIMDAVAGEVRSWVPDSTEPFARFGKKLDDLKGNGGFDFDITAVLMKSPREREHRFGLGQIQKWAKEVGTAV